MSTMKFQYPTERLRREIGMYQLGSDHWAVGDFWACGVNVYISQRALGSSKESGQMELDESSAVIVCRIT